MKDYIVLKAFQGFDPGSIIQISDIDATLWTEKYGPGCFAIADAPKAATKKSEG